MRRHAWSAAAVFLATFLLPGCGEYHPEQNIKLSNNEVADILPTSVAGKPMTLNMPKRIQNPPPTHVAIVGKELHIWSDDAWYGHQVEVFHVPARDISLQDRHFALASTGSVQKIASGTIQPNGTWSVYWPGGAVYVADKQHEFFLIRTNEGQFGLAEYSPAKIHHKNT
ncbi:hypothetical protein [Alicyclobacillus tolerans]|uniref:Lipoprotein n=1 Tax=Alicyclobacillus tolerans TaxID=90970 RepID=A0ABT9LTT8_9BACL|nr:hypothetical protein [Alicyclobacillus tengchongensis]MDP9727679.1 hypothetical protein [Alicyclobacillus tengchongensis]